MSYQLPDIHTLHTLDKAAQEEALGHLFEPCATLNTVIIDNVLTTEFQTYPEMIEAVRIELENLLKADEHDPRISKIIAAHPRLGAPKGTVLSEHSKAEQANLQQGDNETAEKLKALNAEYEQTFPGLRYVVFVNGRSRPAIMENMKQRIQKNDISAERHEAFNAMCDIALDRASKILN